MKILVVDDETIALTSVKRLLKRRGLSDVEMCSSGKAAIDRIRAENFDIVLLDLIMPDVDGLGVIEATKPFRPHTEFIMITAIEDVQTSVRAIRLGAYDYLVKPLDPERLYLSITRAFERRSLRAGLMPDATRAEEQEMPAAFAEIITRDPHMQELIRVAHIVARSKLPILITGESGTGKELFARAIHLAGSDSETPFVPVNVAAVPETLFESQFFGHRAGAFTGATEAHTGYFGQADGGLLYLDEVSEIPVAQQAKFLRVLEDRMVTPLGDKRSQQVNIRLVSSTNLDLNAACREGRFRLDLYYRLNAAQVHLPPLRERQGDIPLLVDYFIQRVNQQYGKGIKGCDRAAMDTLRTYLFPGNVRELKWLMEKAVLICERDYVTPRHLNLISEPATDIAGGENLQTLKENTEAHIAFVVAHCGYDTARAADILGVSQRQVQRRLAEMRRDPAWKDWFAKAHFPGGS